VMWYRGRQRAAPPEILLFVLVVSTLIARPGVVLPTAWTTGILFYLALAFPVAYQFLFGSQELNECGERRPANVLWEVGISCVLLTIAVLEIAAKLTLPGGVDPLTLYLQDVARFFLMVPFAGFLVATAVSAWRTQGAPGPGDARSVEADAPVGSDGIGE
jgi:hypothetical protein